MSARARAAVRVRLRPLVVLDLQAQRPLVELPRRGQVLHRDRRDHFLACEHDVLLVDHLFCACAFTTSAQLRAPLWPSRNGRTVSASRGDAKIS